MHWGCGLEEGRTRFTLRKPCGFGDPMPFHNPETTGADGWRNLGGVGWWSRRVGQVVTY